MTRRRDVAAAIHNFEFEKSEFSLYLLRLLVMDSAFLSRQEISLEALRAILYTLARKSILLFILKLIVDYACVEY